MKQEMMIEVKKVYFSYTPDQNLLKGISFDVNKGEFVALLGENGSGKSTLLKLILGYLQPKKGSIIIKKDNGIGYVPQKLAIDQNHPARVDELIQDSKICSHLDLHAFLKKQFRDLSGGQQQRVLVALVLQQNPDIILLDEPTVGMDAKKRKEFYELLKHLATHHHKTIILITHDNDVIAKYASRLLCIDQTDHAHHGRCVHD